MTERICPICKKPMHPDSKKRTHGGICREKARDKRITDKAEKLNKDRSDGKYKKEETYADSNQKID